MANMFDKMTTLVMQIKQLYLYFSIIPFLIMYIYNYDEGSIYSYIIKLVFTLQSKKAPTISIVLAVYAGPWN